MNSATRTRVIAGTWVALVIGAAWLALREDRLAGVDRGSGSAPSDAPREDRVGVGGVATSSDGRREAIEAPDQAPMSETPATETRTDTARFDDAILVRARVVDRLNRPVPTARLFATSLVRRTGNFDVEPMSGLPIASADAHGRIEWRIDRATIERAHATLGPKGFSYASFVVEAPGFAPVRQTASIHFGLESDLGTITLVAGGRVRGRVVDAKQRPVAGALVATMGAREASFPARRSVLGQAPPWTRSAADGTFALDGVRRDVVCIAAWIDVDRIGPTNAFGASASLDLTTDAAVDDVVVTLDDGPARECRIDGVVLDADGRPTAGMYVTVEGQCATPPSVAFGSRVYLEGQFALCAISNPDGGFALACAPESTDAMRQGQLALRVRDPTHDHADAVVNPVTLGQPQVVVALARARTFDAITLDDAGRPIDGCTVEVSASKNHNGLGSERVANAASPVRLHVPIQPFYVHATRRGHSPATAGPISIDAPQPSITLTLGRIPAVTGVVLADGRPVEGAFVALVEPRKPVDVVEPAPPMMLRSARIHASSPVDSTRTDAQGRFEVFARDAYDSKPAAGLAAPTLFVRADGFASERVALEEGAWRETLDIGVVTLTQGCTLTGRVIGASADDRLLLTADALSVLVARLADDGSFRVPNLCAGTWRAARLDPQGLVLAARSEAAVETLDERILPYEAREAFEVPESQALALDFAVEPPPIALRFAVRWGDVPLELLGVNVTPLDPDCGDGANDGQFAWTSSLDEPIPVRVRRPGRFVVALRTRARGGTQRVLFTETIDLAPGVDATWRCECGATTIDVPAPSLAVPDTWEGAIQSPRNGCFAVSVFLREPDGSARVALIPGLEAQRIDVKNAFSRLTPEGLSAEPTLGAIPTTPSPAAK